MTNVEKLYDLDIVRGIEDQIVSFTAYRIVNGRRSEHMDKEYTDILNKLLNATYRTSGKSAFSQMMLMRALAVCKF